MRIRSRGIYAFRGSYGSYQPLAVEVNPGKAACLCCTPALLDLKCIDPSLDSVLHSKTESALRMTSGWDGQQSSAACAVNPHSSTTDVILRRRIRHANPKPRDLCILRFVLLAHRYSEAQPSFIVLMAGIWYPLAK